MDWSEAGEDAKKQGGGGMFIKLADDGDSVTGVFLGEPHKELTVWTGQGSEPYDENKHKGEKVKARYLVNLFDLETEAPRVLTMNAKTMQLAADLHSRGMLKTWTIEVKRHGAKGDTQTTYQMLPIAQIENVDGLIAKLRAAEPVNLANLRSDKPKASEFSDAHGTDMGDDNIPFAPRDGRLA